MIDARWDGQQQYISRGFTVSGVHDNEHVEPCRKMPSGTSNTSNRTEHTLLLRPQARQPMLFRGCCDETDVSARSSYINHGLSSLTLSQAESGLYLGRVRRLR